MVTATRGKPFTKLADVVSPLIECDHEGKPVQPPAAPGAFIVMESPTQVALQVQKAACQLVTRYAIQDCSSGDSRMELPCGSKWEATVGNVLAGVGLLEECRAEECCCSIDEWAACSAKGSFSR